MEGICYKSLLAGWSKFSHESNISVILRLKSNTLKDKFRKLVIYTSTPKMYTRAMDNYQNLTLLVLAAEFVIILVLFWHLGREESGREKKYRSDERDLIIRLIQSTRRRSVSDETNEFREILVEKLKNRS
jgi:hypothetical protein